MEYNEFDDYGTGFEEAAERKHEEMVNAQTRLLIEERQNRNTGMLAAALLSAVMPAPLVCGNCNGYDHTASDCFPF